MDGKKKIFLTCALYGCALARAEPACGPFHDATIYDDEIMQKVAMAFFERTHWSVHQYDISRSDCAEKIVVIFEGVGKDANVGNHWTFWYIKATDEIRVFDGK